MNPQNLSDVLDILDKGVDKDTKNYIKRHGRAPAVMGGNDLGRAIRNNFLLWNENTPLRRYFDGNFELKHPDDISWFIEEAFAARLRGEERYEYGDLLEKVRLHWVKEKQPQYCPLTIVLGKRYVSVK